MKTQILPILLFGLSIIYDTDAYPAKQEPEDLDIYNRQHCIKMTPENEEKMTAIVTKLSDYLYNLTIEYEVFDIRLLKIEIDGHYDDEVEEKDTEIQLIVNDCSQSDESDDQTTKIDPDDKKQNISPKQSNARQTADEVNHASNVGNTSDVTESNTQNAVSDKTVNGKPNGGEDDTVTENDDTKNKSTDDNEQNDQTAVDLKRSDRYLRNDDSEIAGIHVNDIQPSYDANFEVRGPVLVRLDLDKTGNKLIRGTQVKRGEHVPLILYIQKISGGVQYLLPN